MLGCRVKQIFSRLLLLGALVFAVLLGLGILNIPSSFVQDWQTLFSAKN